MRFIFVSILFFLQIFCFGNVVSADEIPSHIANSFAQGILNNAGLTRVDLERLALTVIRARQGTDKNQSKIEIAQLSISELKALATQSFPIEYIEIPEQHLLTKGEFSSETTQLLKRDQIMSPIRFMKDGEVWVRWFIHPMREDTSYREFLGDRPIQRGRFLGLLTESRSLIVYDRAKTKAWSIKVSLPVAVGQFQDKSYPVRDAQVHFRASEAILRSQALAAHPDLGILPEQEFVGIKGEGFDEAQIVRNIDVLSPGKKMISFSSFFTSEFFREKGLGWSDSEVIEWFARKPGTLAALVYGKLGLLHNSNHTQNTVILMDEDGKPERVLLRDPDYELDKTHPNAEKTHAQIPSGIFNRKALLDYSMLNGMKENFPAEKGPRFLKLVFNYFYSFFQTYSKIRNEPFHKEDVEKIIDFTSIKEQDSRKLTHFMVTNPNVDPKTHFTATVADYFDDEKKSKGLAISEIEGIRIQVKNSKIKRIMDSYPSLKNFPTNPIEGIPSILLALEQRRGIHTPPMKDLRDLYPDATAKLEEQLIRDFMNEKLRSRSLIQKVLDQRDPIAFWNLCLMIRHFNLEGNQRFFYDFLKSSSGFAINDGFHFLFEYKSPLRSFEKSFMDLFKNYIKAATRKDKQEMLINAYDFHLFDITESLTNFMDYAGSEILKEIWATVNNQGEHENGVSKYIAKHKNELLHYFNTHSEIMRSFGSHGKQTNLIQHTGARKVKNQLSISCITLFAK